MFDGKIMEYDHQFNEPQQHAIILILLNIEFKICIQNNPWFHVYKLQSSWNTGDLYC